MDVTYPSPVTVNGYSCSNCTQVDRAKAHIDPAHPRSGAFDVDAASDPTRTAADKAEIAKHNARTTAETRPYSPAGIAPAALGLSVDLRG